MILLYVAYSPAPHQAPTLRCCHSFAGAMLSVLTSAVTYSPKLASLRMTRPA